MKASTRYYGDDIGDPGGNDPDNRRMMRFDTLSTSETHTRNITSMLGNLRRNNLALIYGDLTWLQVENDLLLYNRKYFSNTVWVVFNKSGREKKLILAVPPSATTNFYGTLSFENENATLTLPAHSFEIITN